MHAMHAICHRVDGRPDNLTIIDARAGLYGSGWWELGADQMDEVVGGWLYLHETSKADSHFVAKIEGVERRDNVGRVELRVRKIAGIKDQPWRGGRAGQNPQHYFKIVPASYDQEREP